MALFGLGIMINNNTLKCNGQCPKLIQALVMLMMLLKYLLSLTTYLRYFYNILSVLEVDKLLYLLITIVNSFLEKEFHGKCYLDRISSNKELLTCQL